MVTMNTVERPLGWNCSAGKPDSPRAKGYRQRMEAEKEFMCQSRDKIR